MIFVKLLFTIWRMEQIEYSWEDISGMDSFFALISDDFIYLEPHNYFELIENAVYND